MNLTTIISGLFVIALIILPLLYFYWKNQAKIKKMSSQLIEFAQQNHLLLNRSDCLDNIAIGVDATKNALLYCRIANDKEYKELIDLNVQKKCILQVQRSQGESKSIERIHIQLFSKNQTEVALEFYNFENNVPLLNELILAEKWVKIINEQIK